MNRSTTALYRSGVPTAVGALSFRWQLLAIVLVSCGTAASATTDPSSSSPSSSGSASFQEWFQARCGPNGHSTWLYQGGLFDPLTGSKLAHVEGLEIVQAVPNLDQVKEQTDDDSNKLDNNQPNHHQLSIQPSLQHPDAKYKHSGTLLSQKIFIYRDKNDKKTLLQSIKLRPYSPERKIPLDQAVSAYCTMNTFIERTPNEWIVHGEWPDGRTVWNQAAVLRDKDASTTWPQQQEQSTKRLDSSERKPSSSLPTSKSLEFTVHVRPRFGSSLNLPLSSRGPDLTTEPITLSYNDSSTNAAAPTTKSPPRSSLFSMGRSKSEKLSTGARETYQYEWTLPPATPKRPSLWSRIFGSSLSSSSSSASSSSTPLCSVRYTRYGEGPVWYGPNRFCALELRGQQWTDSQALPEHIAAWCRRHGWGNNETAAPPTTTDLVQAFRRADLDLEGIFGGSNATAANPRSAWRQNLQKWGTRLRESISLEAPDKRF